MVKISIIVPVYNKELYLAECLNSLLQQSIKDFEIICINDGSTDNSGKILDEYALKDNRIKVFHRKNKGVGKTRNEGILLAKGEFIAFMDADDFYPKKETLENIYNSANENNALICGGSIAYCEENEIKVFNTNFYDKKNYFAKNGFIDYQDYQFDYAFYRFIYNREFLVKNKIFFPSYIRFEDPVFFVKAMYLAKKFYALEETTYIYRINCHKFSCSKQVQIDTLRGICDNLDFAKKHKLNKLYKITLYHLYAHRIFFRSEETYLSVCIYLLILAYFKNKYFMSILRRIVSRYVFSEKSKKNLKKYLHHEKICLWGASLFIEDFIAKHKLKNKNILGIIDNNPSRQGEKIGDYSIISAAQIEEIKPKYILLTIKNNHRQRYNDVKEYIEKNNLDVILLPDIFEGDNRYV